MLRLAMVFVVLLMGCSNPDRDDDAAETEPVPIGPGSDSTTLLPPDTPMTIRPSGRPDTPATTTR